MNRTEAYTNHGLTQLDADKIPTVGKNKPLPEGWEWKKLGEVCEVISGQSPKSKFYNKNGDGLPFYRGKKGFTEKFIDSPNTWTTNITKEAQKDDILMSVRAPVGPVNFATQNICIGRGLSAIRARNTVDKFFLFYFLVKHKNEITGNNGAVFNSINRDQIKAIQIPLSPLAEQKRIVAILDEAFAAIDKAKANAEKNLDNAKELFESYLNGIFENPGEDWEAKKLGDVCEFVRGPFGGSLKKTIFKSSGYAVYEQQHAINDQFVNIRYFIDEKKYNEMRRFELKAGDLIMSCSGTMGRTAIVPETFHKGIINQALLKLTPKNSLSVRFLKLWMESNDFLNQIAKHSQGAAIKNVSSVKTLKKIRLKLPSKKTQNELIKKVYYFSKETSKLKKIYNDKITALDELKKSILKKAFEGGIMTQPSYQTEIILYKTTDGNIKIDTVFQNETIWLTQAQMAELFGVKRPAVTKHLKNIFESGELDEQVVSSILEHTTSHGAIEGKNQTKQLKYYNLDAIIAVGYRVNSKRATQFRIWATNILKEYIIKGFAMDDERLKQADRWDYFDEWLERIRDIRASEKRFYQKIRDIYTTAIDYDKNSQQAQNFFKKVQNKMLWAVTGKTAAELIELRSDQWAPNMGLTSWRGSIVRKYDVDIAKNYLKAGEIKDLNEIVTMYLDYAELQARQRKTVTMEQWSDKLDAFLEFNEQELLTHAGKVKAVVAKKLAEERYEQFDKKRKIEEAKKADKEDIKKLEEYLKRYKQ